MSAEPPRAGERPLAGLITAAAAGRFPDPDGGWERVPPWRPGSDLLVPVTGGTRPASAAHAHPVTAPASGPTAPPPPVKQ